ncbi:hypothetical protein [uncultured Roseobacter sp.]|uniref:hypothetical protein n=1 Tax=uncultured Roseobacter sp. TaxID=114847 RepID=UPI00261CBD3D|nr:hypothetical protein [uncultured Roseobacter sp.]
MKREALACVTDAGLLAGRVVDGVVIEALGVVCSEDVKRDAFARVTGLLPEPVEPLLRDVVGDVSATSVGRDVGVGDDPLLPEGADVVRIEEVYRDAVDRVRLADDERSDSSPEEKDRLRDALLLGVDGAEYDRVVAVEGVE